jgi:hypothetical protein
LVTPALPTAHRSRPQCRSDQTIATAATPRCQPIR